MVIHVAPELETALNELARRQGVTPDKIVADALRAVLPPSPAPKAVQEEWERRLRTLSIDCGVTLPDAAVSSEGLYE